MSLESTFYHDLPGHQSDSGALGDRSALWPALEQTWPSQPSPQQPFPHPAGGSVGQTGVPVPLYSVPGTGGSLAVTGTPGGGAWEETQQIHPPVGKTWVRSFEGKEAKREVQGPVGGGGVRAHKALNGGRAPDYVAALGLVLCMRLRDAAPFLCSLPLHWDKRQGQQQFLPPSSWMHSF